MNLDETKIGNLELDKGIVRKGVSLYAWDGIRECTNLECPVVDQCKYVHCGKCAVQVEYIQTLYNTILNTYSYLDETMLFKIGMEIVPLYVHLIRLQIIELSLNTPIVFSEKGNIGIHPVYREIRETMKAIGSMWKNLEISFEFGEKLKLSGKKKSGNGNAPDFEKGDPEFYKRISSEGTSRKGVIR